MLPKIRFAPMDVPLHRRRQTFAVLFNMFLAPGLLICANPLLVYLMWADPLSMYSLAYVAILTWTYVDRGTSTTHGRSWMPMRSHIVWRWFADYFPARVVVEEALPKDRGCILAVSPHGFLSLGVWANLVGQANKTCELLGRVVSIVTVSLHFYVPIWREWIMSHGFLDASRATFDYQLSHNRCVTVVVGGAAEALDSRPGTNDVILRRRLGFVRAALKHGAYLVPVFAFGETSLYKAKVFERGTRARDLLERLRRALGFSTPFMLGRGVFNYDFGILPRRRHVTTVIGKAIPCKKIPEPTERDVTEKLEVYIAALEALFDKHKESHAEWSGKPVGALRIVE